MKFSVVVTEIEALVSPVDHNKLVPVADNIELPQLLLTVTVGADGKEIGLAVADPGELVHPPTVCVTE